MPTAPRNRWERALRDAALAYPETHQDFPWEDHRAIKVRGKMFVNCLLTAHSCTRLALSEPPAK